VGHVIVVGYGVNGRNLARVLDAHDIPMVVVEINADRATAARRDGRGVVYGDVTRAEVLAFAGARDARVLVLAMSDAGATRRAADVARRLNARIHILARTRYVTEIEPLTLAGADEVVAEEYETSIEIFTRVLRRFLVPRDDVERSVQAIRASGYEMMRSLSAPRTPATALGHFVHDLELEVVGVPTGSPVAGRTLAESGLRDRTGASVVAVQRQGDPVRHNPNGREPIVAGDVLLLLGTTAQIAVAAALVASADVEVGDGGAGDGAVGDGAAAPS
jgi:CPA2 family monovalent cation:H+ antiporter-2